MPFAILNGKTFSNNQVVKNLLFSMVHEIPDSNIAIYQYNMKLVIESSVDEIIQKAIIISIVNYCVKKGLNTSILNECVTRPTKIIVSDTNIVHLIPETILMSPKFSFICTKEFKVSLDMIELNLDQELKDKTVKLHLDKLSKIGIHKTIYEEIMNLVEEGKTIGMDFVMKLLELINSLLTQIEQFVIMPPFMLPPGFTPSAYPLEVDEVESLRYNKQKEQFQTLLTSVETIKTYINTVKLTEMYDRIKNIYDERQQQKENMRLHRVRIVIKIKKNKEDVELYRQFLEMYTLFSSRRLGKDIFSPDVSNSIELQEKHYKKICTYVT